MNPNRSGYSLLERTPLIVCRNEHGFAFDCPYCNGEGAYDELLVFYREPQYKRVRCDNCSGSGSVNSYEALIGIYPDGSVALLCEDDELFYRRHGMLTPMSEIKESLGEELFDKLQNSSLKNVEQVEGDSDV